MEQIKTQAVVLRTVAYKDNDKLLTLFSLENGKIFAGIKGVLKPKAKLAFAAQPFCFGTFHLAQKGTYSTVVGCDAEDLFFDITKDIERYYYGATLLEICDILVKENEPNVALFINLLKALKLLAYDKCEPLAVVNKFVIDALKFAGYKIDFLKCKKCLNETINKPFFSFSRGGVVCFPCASREYPGDIKELSNGEFAIFKLLQGVEIENLTRYKFSSQQNLLSCLKLLVAFFAEKTECKIKSCEQLFKMIG